MEIVNIVIYACITVFALGLFIISLFSYKKSKNSKILFVSIVFIFFLLKGLLHSYNLFTNLFNDFFLSPYIAVFDFLILVLLFIATLKR